ncbi:hypothetical protein LSAT2_013902 [Lamellibrachia satsuma]|nr:hypothetical protein LSAT2_013902 [Lamellibrachia satsuma]
MSSSTIVSQFGKLEYEEIEGRPSEGDQVARKIKSKSSGSDVPILGPFYHHGIYIGGTFVIDYNNNSIIRRVSLIEFKAGESLYRVTYGLKPDPLKPKEVVKKPEEALQTPEDFGDYADDDNNCEHFATYCKYGVRVSQQVVDVVQKGLQVIAGVVGVASAVSTAVAAKK